MKNYFFTSESVTEGHPDKVADLISDKVANYLINQNKVEEAKKLFGKILVTPQTGPEGKKVNRIYIQKAYDIDKEFFLLLI